MSDVDNLSDELSSLICRVKHLTDLEEIRTLQHAFWRACDGDFVAGPTHYPEVIADLCTPDASWRMNAVEAEGESLPALSVRGREEIIEWFRGAQRRQSFVLHFGGLPILSVEGDDAHGTWRVLTTMTVGGSAYWGAAGYETQYRRTRDGWRISDVLMTRAFRAPFESGWAKSRYTPDWENR
jgi:hypothetical protein